ncbi:MAG: M1 family metallopeptidase, partial [Fluviicola sp.]|nr:M1 family metallopeptidase [Fluviicola sp.]
MKNLFFLTLITFITFSATSQSYWQQEVNYKIEVKLDDSKHELTAFEEFEYINNSPNQLDFLYIHLWPNAYQNEKTALGKQQWNSGETLLKYGDDSLKGNISGLDFKINGEAVKWELDSKNIDICKLMLKTPLLPGQRLTVSTPFKVKIPTGEISRLGHVGQSYQITQWYPKPAVYDKNGWNPIPYLNQGEFYSEFGSFDVSITLPKNYVLGATGDCQTPSEIDFLTDLALKTRLKFENGELNEGRKANMNFPASSSEYKTIRYTQSKVHDFAWFADKRYEVLKGEVELPASKRKVTSWAMFTPRNAEVWKNAIEYINDGTYYYSLWNGDYPYNNVTAVDGTISAGGGMEYPTITVIGNTGNKEELEVVIVHEVGHNWFYGILGSNERVHGWMDEGMNTLNEVRYVQTKYPENTRFSDMILNGKFHLDNLDHHDLSDISYRFTAVMGEDQPIETHSADFTGANYGSIMYMKTGLVMFYLKDYLGEELFGKCQHAYFEEWKFKHPQPEDMRASFEKTSGKDLSWLFKDLIQTTNHIDYKIVNVKKVENGTEVKVKNKGQVNGPIEVSAYEKGVLVEKTYAEPGENYRTVHFKSTSIDEVRIDSDKNIPEISRT